jgi:hypothetical protein
MKQILSEEFQRMQKLAGIINESLDDEYNYGNVRNWKQFLKESSESDRVYRRISNAPHEITIEITEIGKNFIKEFFGEILRKSQPDYYEKTNPNWFPSYTLDLVDKITLKMKTDTEISRNETPKRIGSMTIDQDMGVPYEKKWTTLSPMFTSDAGYRGNTFDMYAFYIPFVDYLQGYDTTEKAAMILIRAGVDFNNSRQIGNFTPLDKGYDTFDKFEVGQVSDKKYFKILKID